MERIRTGVFYYCPVCGQPSGSSIPQSECLTCAASRSNDFASSPPPIQRSPSSTATSLSLLLSDDEDELTNSLLWHVNEHNYGALDLEWSRRHHWDAVSDADYGTDRLAATPTTASVSSDADADGEGVVASRDRGRCSCHTVVWLVALLGFWAVIGAGVLVLVFL
ncbi:hypothetical protein ED733_003166 [Metarhizium rileyi]|uniref:Uncharacterized protein n=1 Tax=Metarhizium rileyi (strain RCEF 4871) TaxID=1649241 RepID=A0A5C6GAS6_METRR|nr:hypothetical protein ED733_003166 [Metarhizium rileyi]